MGPQIQGGEKVAGAVKPAAGGRKTCPCINILHSALVEIKGQMIVIEKNSQLWKNKNKSESI